MKKSFIMLFLLVVISFLLLAGGCRKEQLPPAPQATPAPTLAPSPARTAVPTPQAIERTPPPVTRPPSTPVTGAPPGVAVAPLSLTVESPAPESIVRERSVVVRGKTAPDAIVTVGSKNVEVDENGSFSTRVDLAEGVNVIEVLASDLSGATKGQVLTVIYAP